MLYKLILATFAIQAVSAQNQWYPLSRKDEARLALKPFEHGSKLPIECMSRNIDNGEHRIDEEKNIIFEPFAICKETKEPLAFHYGVNEEISCTVGITDELFHLFQLYLHEDAPFSCRLPISSEVGAAQNGLSVPLLLALRGTLSDSHIHVDNHLNVLNIKPAGFNGLISGIGFSAGTNVTRVIIGDMLKLNFAVRWLDIASDEQQQKQKGDWETYHYASGFYRLPSNLNKSLSSFPFYIIITAIISSLATYGVIYVRFNKKNLHNPIFDYDSPPHKND